MFVNALSKTDSEYWKVYFKRTFSQGRQRGADQKNKIQAQR